MHLTLWSPIAAAWRTDLLERDLEPASVEDGAVTLSLRPFELVTLRLQLSS